MPSSSEVAKSLGDRALRPLTWENTVSEARVATYVHDRHRRDRGVQALGGPGATRAGTSPNDVLGDVEGRLPVVPAPCRQGRQRGTLWPAGPCLRAQRAVRPCWFQAVFSSSALSRGSWSTSDRMVFAITPLIRRMSPVGCSPSANVTAVRPAPASVRVKRPVGRAGPAVTRNSIRAGGW